MQRRTMAAASDADSNRISFVSAKVVEPLEHEGLVENSLGSPVNYLRRK